MNGDCILRLFLTYTEIKKISTCQKLYRFISSFSYLNRRFILTTSPVAGTRPDTPNPFSPTLAGAAVLPAVWGFLTAPVDGFDLDVMTRTAKDCTLPLVDMGASPVEVARIFGKALSELGFVAVTNVGIDQAVVDAFYAAAETYFSLPEDEKLKQFSGNGLQGFIPQGTEHAKDSTKPNLMEMFQMLGIRSEAFQGYWPSPDFKEKAEALYTMLEGSVKHCLRALALFLGEHEEALAELLGEGNSVMRSIHYPPVSPETPEGTMRAAPHEDICMMTLIPRATAAGLEVLQKDGTYLPVVVPEGAAIINAGDTLMRLTGGSIPSTTHRVVNPREDFTSHRYSVPFFGQPAQETVISVLPSCRGIGKVAPDITFGELLQERLRAIGLKRLAT